MREISVKDWIDLNKTWWKTVYLFLQKQQLLVLAETLLVLAEITCV
jgi:hypothetical protein